MPKAIIILIVILGVAALFVGGYFLFFHHPMPELSSDEQAAVDLLCTSYIDQTLTQVTEKDVERVVAIGDRAVPYLVEAIKKDELLHPYRKEDSAEVISCLARIGTPEATDAICLLLEQDLGKREGSMYAIVMDRLTAAKALVLLGAEDKAPLLEKVLDDQKEIENSSEIEAGEFAGLILKNELDENPSERLEDALDMLRTGEGQGPIDGLAWVTMPDGTRTKGSSDRIN